MRLWKVIDTGTQVRRCHRISVQGVNPVQAKDTIRENRIEGLLKETNCCGSGRNYIVNRYADKRIGILEACAERNINLILLTHPSLTESQSPEHHAMEFPNDSMRKFAIQQNLLLIALSFQLEKNFIYYADSLHFPDEGNRKITEILREYLR